MADQETNLPTDEQYRDYLFTLWGTPLDDVVIARSIKHDPTWLDGVDPALATDFLSSKNFSRGTLVRGLQDQALRMTGSFAARLASVPVAFLPKEDINACAVRTPRNGAVILLNTSLIHFLPFISMCAGAIASPGLAADMSPNLTDLDYAKSLYAIAMEFVDPDAGLMMRSPVISDPILGKKREEDPNYTLIRMHQGTIWTWELFILLHEYGHVALDHLSTSRLRHARNCQDVEVYTLHHTQEYDADEFALQCLFRGRDVEEKENVQMQLGVLFGFFALLEACAEGSPASSHPHATDRWRRLRKLAGAEDELQFADLGMNIFERIIAVVEADRSPFTTSAARL